MSKFVVLSFIILVSGTAFVFFEFNDAYTPGTPETRCDIPYDYPICHRTEQPPGWLEKGPDEQMIGIAVTTVLGIILLVVALLSTVRNQKDIAAPTAKAQPRHKGPASTGAHKAYAGGHTPATIQANAIPKDAVKEGENRG